MEMEYNAAAFTRLIIHWQELLKARDMELLGKKLLLIVLK